MGMRVYYVARNVWAQKNGGAAAPPKHFEINMHQENHVSRRFIVYTDPVLTMFVAISALVALIPHAVSLEVSVYVLRVAVAPVLTSVACLAIIIDNVEDEQHTWQ